MKFFEELVYRGLIKDCTDLQGLKEKLNNDSITCYCGIDPTADSLHIGHLQQVILLRRYQLAGHKVIALCGGATGMIGDPRPTTERKLISLQEVAHNVEAIKKQVAKFVDFNKNALLLNNFDWLGSFKMLEFLRDYGKHFNVSYMIAKDTISSRLSSGISFTEFTYTILQAADFLHLYQNHNCTLQIGGSDQWGNLVSGVDLIRKVEGESAKVYGVTSPLITKSDGSKFGKSEGGNIWLDASKTSPYEFYQFLVNISDNDIINMLKKLSFTSIEEIEKLEIEVKERPHNRLAQKTLAKELTELVHGKDELDNVLRITDTLFNNDFTKLTASEIKIALKDAKTIKIENNTNIVDLLTDSKIVSSKREARELISNNSIQINGLKETNLDRIISIEDAIDKELIILKKGKKNYFILTF